MALKPDVSKAGMQARADRHNQALSAAERSSQKNQDWDHYLVGNEMAGPQFPLWQRLGAALPMILHEAARPVLSRSKTAVAIANKVVNPSGDQPAWIAEGAGAGGAAAEPPVSFAQALRNLDMLRRGAVEGSTPSEGEWSREASRIILNPNRKGRAK